MIRSILVAGVLAVGGLALPGPASAFERHTTIDTNHGTITRDADVYCFGRTCYRQSELTGVNGNTLQSSGSCSRVAFHTWRCRGTVTGPEGHSVSGRGFVHFN